jgi:nucleotide-binding universal stress UspA family protein
MDDNAKDTTPMDAVLVGTDGSPHALAAVRWASAEAASRGAPLVLAHVADYLDADGGPPAQARRARGVMSRSLHETREILDPDRVQTKVVAGDPLNTLVELSEPAALLVLGLTGTGGMDEVLLGSTTLALSGRARCPLVGVREWPRPASDDRFVLVGLDSVAGEESVLDVAFDMARRSGCAVLLLHARSGVPFHSHHTLAGTLAPWRSRYPDVEVRYEQPAGMPSTELLGRADRAEAVVLGSRKRGPAARALLGSTGRTLLRYSHAPTIVVGPEALVRPPVTPMPDDARDPHALSNLW